METKTVRLAVDDLGRAIGFLPPGARAPAGNFEWGWRDADHILHVEGQARVNGRVPRADLWQYACRELVRGVNY